MKDVIFELNPVIRWFLRCLQEEGLELLKENMFALNSLSVTPRV